MAQPQFRQGWWSIATRNRQSNLRAPKPPRRAPSTHRHGSSPLGSHPHAPGRADDNSARHAPETYEGSRWLGDLDSNQDWRSQSPLSYR